jgi:hypothetical protein
VPTSNEPLASTSAGAAVDQLLMKFSLDQSMCVLRRYLNLEGATELLKNPRHRTSILLDVINDESERQTLYSQVI